MDRAVQPINAQAAPSAAAGTVTVEEVSALVGYASERGIDSAGTRKLYELLHQLPAGQATLSRPDEAPVRAELFERYGSLAKQTFPVTGRTVLDTSTRFQVDIRPLKHWTVILLVLAVGNEMMKAWLAAMPEPKEGALLLALDFRRYVLEYFAPFMWGALGSIAYLLKRLSDYAEDQTYDSATSHGWAVRIFLGSMLGGLMQFLYDPQLFSEGSVLKVSNIAIGFLTGVGVKVVYGALEKTIEVLAEKLNLDSTRAAKADKTAPAKQAGAADRTHGTDTKTADAGILGGGKTKDKAA